MVVAGGRDAIFLGLLIGVVLTGVASAQTTGLAIEWGGDVDREFTDDPQVLGVPSISMQTTDNNSSDRHEPKEQLNERGDNAALQQWLAGYLGSQIEESAVKLEQSEYERAKSVVGDSYREQLEKYVEVSEETEGETDDETAERFEETREQQQEYVSAVQKYRETYCEYQAARRAGNKTRARKLARELNDLAGQIQQTGANLTANYATISTKTGTDLTQANQSITNTNSNISSQQREVRNEAFTNTIITITRRTANASFHEPIQLEGNLTAVNGTALADEKIEVTLGDRKVETRTTNNGSFTVSLRPTITPLGRQSVSIKYIPRPSTVFLRTNTSIPVNISQTTPSVTLARTPTTVKFNDTVTVRGRVHAGAVTASGVPVQVTIGNTVLDTTRTAENGTYTFTSPLPADIPAGEQSINVSLPLEDQALAPASSSATVQVTPTPTQVTVQQANPSGEGYVSLYGTLTTALGTPLANESVQIRVGEQTITTAATNTTGEYEVQVRTDALATASESTNDSVAVTAAYPGQGNLQATRAQIRLAGIIDDSWLPETTWLVAGGAVVFSALGVGLHRFGIGPQIVADALTATDTPTATDSAEDDHTQETETTSPAVRALREHAESQLAAGRTDTAVQTAYAAVRRQLIDNLGWKGQQAAAQTYWEFYHACRGHDVVTDAQLTALEQLTQHYECTRFTTSAVAEDAATDAVDTASDFLETFEQMPSTDQHGDTPPTRQSDQ
jgi:hypothetical protein